MIKYTFNKQINIIELIAQDIITIDQIISYYLSISKDKSLPRNLKTLVDCTNGKLQIDLNKKEIEQASLALNTAIEVFDSIQEAVVVDKPYNTVVTTLFRDFNCDIKNFDIKIFCTQKASLEWLLHN